MSGPSALTPLSATSADGRWDRRMAELAGRQHGIVARSSSGAGPHRERDRSDGCGAGASIASIPASTPWGIRRSRSGGGGWRRCLLRGREPCSAIGRRRRCGGSGDRGRGRCTSPCRGRPAREARSVATFGALPVDEVTIRRRDPGRPPRPAPCWTSPADKGEAAAESALREMEYLGIYGPVSIPTLLARHPHHRGAAIVARCLERLARRPRRQGPQPARGTVPPLPRCPPASRAHA